MASKKPVKEKENLARKPVVQKAMSDTSGSNLADFKNKAVDAAKVVASRVAVGPLQLLLDNKQVKSVAAETSGINDVKRFSKNPSVGNAAMVALSAAQYVAPLVKPIQAVRAANAANVARELPIAESALVKTLRLGTNEATGIREGILRGVGEVRDTVKPIQTRQVNLFGRDMEAKYFRLFETTKSPARVAASRASSASQRVIQKGKQIESNLNFLAAGNALRQTARATEPKPKKK